jgi:hypothetical protein
VHNIGLGRTKEYIFESITTEANEVLFITRQGLGAYPLLLNMFGRNVFVLFSHGTKPMLEAWRRYAIQMMVEYTP